MAQKEATVYIVDVGCSMGETGSGRDKSNLDWALEYVYDKITTTVATGRKTALAGVVAFRTDGTLNDYREDEAYSHISVVQDITQIQMPELRKLRQELVVNQSDSGDAMSALAIAVQMISKQCKKLQYMRRIVLVTDARAPMDAEDMSQIVQKIKEDNMELIVLGVDFDDADYGYKEESKDLIKAENEEVFRKLCDDCNGLFGTMAQATEELGIPRVKSTKPVPSYKGMLTLGGREDFPDTAIGIYVERYPKTMVARPPTASNFVVRANMAAGEKTQSSGTLVEDGTEEAAPEANANGLTSVKSARTYQVADENAPGGLKDIPQEELSKGYEYGRTAVHISESDRNVTDYETLSGLEIIGFIEKGNYERYMDMSRANLIVASRADERASMALSSLIHALYELESYAIARYVAKDNKDPLLLLLVPNIEPDFECLYDVELPYAEDLRSYKFPPLDRVVTVSGKTLRLHRNLPSEDLLEAVSDYVDSMDLATFGKDDEGEATEYAPPDETFSPMLHRINQVIKHRAVFPDEPPPAPFEILTRYSNPPPDQSIQAIQFRPLALQFRGRSRSDARVLAR